MQSKATSIFTTAIPAACLSVLTACGGGGGGSSSTTTPTPTPTPNVVVTGVAAIGAPLVDASIRVVDGNGAPVKLLDANQNAISFVTTNVADGSYKLTLSTATPSLPLFLEAVGTDGTGTPVLLHSLLASTTTPVVANITPLTDAVVAELLGANPRTVFQNASSNAGAIAALGNATMVAAASTQIKGIIAKNLTDAKITAPTTLNLFQDPAFTTNKTLLDAALEGLRIQIVQDASGADQLQLNNRFVPIQTPEVEIKLATAKAQLNLGATGKLASAIVSTATTTTSATATLTNIGSLDSLTAAINNLIAQRAGTSIAPNTTFTPLISATPAPPSPASAKGVAIAYSYNGRDSSQLEQLLTNYSSNDYQLSSMQITGCIDDPIPSKGCVNLAVSAVVTDSSGNLVDVFSDGITYSKTTTPNWMISGNGRSANIGIYPVAYAVFGFDGTLVSSPPTNPAVGIQVSIQAQDSTGTESVVNASAQLPSGQSVPFAYCGVSTLCLWTNPAVQPIATGDLMDSLLQPPALGWIGNVDAIAGAKYIISYASLLTATQQTANAYLSTALPSDTSTSLFPAIDGISSSAPLTGATIVNGFTLSWANWAAANPNMRVISVRSVIVSTGSSPVITDTPIPLGNGTSVTLQPVTLPGFTPTSYEIWIGAVDNLGQRYYTQMVGSS
jgi:hypothetical protein